VSAEYGIRTFASIEELCDSPDVEAVYVATPNFLHEQHVLAAVHRGIHVIVEKPMAVTVEQCDRMIAAADRAGVQLLCGHTHSFNPPIRALHNLSLTGSLGRLRMVQAWNFTDLLYRPRAAWELDTTQGGGVVYIQAPHQVDIIRLIGGGLVRRVRAMSGSWDSARPTEGAYSAFLEFEDGAAATLAYSGYAHFDSAELHDWIGERGQPRPAGTNAQSRLEYRSRGPTHPAKEAGLRDARRYGGRHDPGRSVEASQKHQFFGYMLFTFERADVRQSPDGLVVYDDTGRHEVEVPTEPSGAYAMIDELCRAIADRRPAPHDGRWGAATLEVCQAILQSSRERREVALSHQVPYRG
jgi:phthalate 4,5-cis-dihydrodiol dehydrogenase